MGRVSELYYECTSVCHGFWVDCCAGGRDVCVATASLEKPEVLAREYTPPITLEMLREDVFEVFEESWFERFRK